MTSPSRRSSRGSGCSTSGSNGRDGGPSRSASTSHTPVASSTCASPASRTSGTSPASTPPTSPTPPSGPVGSPASPSASPARDGRRTTIGGYGRSGRDSFAWFDPESSCWRTSQTSWLSTTDEHSERYSGTWPRSGMTLNGTAYRLPPSAPRTSAIASGSSLPGPNGDGLWPTPTTGEPRDPVRAGRDAAGDGGAHVADATDERTGWGPARSPDARVPGPATGDRGSGQPLAHPDGARPQGHRGRGGERLGPGEWAPGPGSGPLTDWWLTEPDVGRVAHGVPARVDRLRCLGNGVVPQVAEFLGWRLRALVEGW